MKTFIDTINFGVKNWWVSLLLGLLYILIAICLMFTPLASYVALSVLFSVSMFVSGTLEILFGQYRPEHGSAAFHRRFLADVPRFRFNRLRYGPETLRDTQLGLVYGFRRTGNPLQYRHYLATRSWSVIPCLYDRVHFADHRHLPGYAFLRTEELAQTEQRIQRINRMLFSAVSNP